MKKTMLAALVILCAMIATPALAGDVPDLQGKWETVEMMMYSQERNAFRTLNPPTGIYDIQRQQGRMFHGVKTYRDKGSVHREQFSGIITLKNELLINEHTDGFSLGDILSMDEIVIYYMETGPNGKTYMQKLKRK